MYRVDILPAARRQIKKLPPNVKARIVERLEDIAIEPRLAGAIKLEGESSLYRVRVGDYRIIYAIDDDQILVLVIKVGHRRDVYR